MLKEEKIKKWWLSSIKKLWPCTSALEILRRILWWFCHKVKQRTTTVCWLEEPLWNGARLIKILKKKSDEGRHRECLLGNEMKKTDSCPGLCDVFVLCTVWEAVARASVRGRRNWRDFLNLGARKWGRHLLTSSRSVLATQLSGVGTWEWIIHLLY